VALVAQHADDFGRERGIEQVDDRLAIGFRVAPRDGALHHLIARAQRGQIRDEGGVAPRHASRHEITFHDLTFE
jgi:hypothetical protein